MTSPKAPPEGLPTWADPVWSSDTLQAREEQLRGLARAQARGSLLFRIVRGEDTRKELAQLEAQAEAMEAMEQEVAGAWMSAAMVESGGERRWSRIGAVVLALALLCGAVIASVWLR